MKESFGISWATLLVAVLLAGLPGCAPAPRPDEKLDLAKGEVLRLKDAREDPLFNKAELLNHHVALPASWDERCSAPERLVGHYIALVPEKKSPTGHRVEVLGHVLNKQGNRAVVLKKGGGVRYKGRVDGNSASALSFVSGRLEIKKDCLYDLTVTDDRAFHVAAQKDFLDRKKVGKVWGKLPKKYRDIFFVSSAAASTITAREYPPLGGDVQGIAAAAKMGDTYYREGGGPATRQALYLTLLSDGGLFGDFDERSGLYNKKGRFEKVNLENRNKAGTLVSFQTMKLLRNTLAVQGLPFPD